MGKKDYDKSLATLQTKLNKLQNEHDKLVKIVDKNDKDLANESKQIKKKMDEWSFQIVQAKCTSGNQRWVGECTANCPNGYKLVSGGCETSSEGWHLRQSMKVNNGWKCRVRNSHGSGAYNGAVTGYAYCIK